MVCFLPPNKSLPIAPSKHATVSVAATFFISEISATYHPNSPVCRLPSDNGILIPYRHITKSPSVLSSDELFTKPRLGIIVFSSDPRSINYTFYLYILSISGCIFRALLSSHDPFRASLFCSNITTVQPLCSGSTTNITLCFNSEHHLCISYSLGFRAFGLSRF